MKQKRGMSRLRVKKPAGKISEIKKRFLDQLSSLPPTTTLVLVIEDARSWDSKAGGKNWEVLKASHFLVKWIDQQAGKVLVKPFSLPDPKDMPKWIQTEAASKKCTFKPDAAAELAQYVGNDTRLAAMEIEKLALYVGEKRPVEVEDVMALSTSTSSATIWKLVDAIGKKDTRQALSLYHQLLETHDVNFEIYPMIVRQFRQLLMAREVLDERGNTQAIMRELGVPQFVADNLGRQAANFTMPSPGEDLLSIDEDRRRQQEWHGGVGDRHRCADRHGCRIKNVVCRSDLGPTVRASSDLRLRPNYPTVGRTLVRRFFYPHTPAIA